MPDNHPPGEQPPGEHPPGEAAPTVSVVVPVHNGARTLALCLRSVADQTYRPLETIVVDDASTDGSGEIARASGATVLRTPVNGGQSVARNLGAAHARGSVLFFLDADVALDRDAVGRAVAALLADPRIGAMCGVYGPEPLLPPSRAARYRAAQQYVWFNEVEGTIPGLHTALFAIRAEVFRETGPFDPELRHTEDQEYGYRLARRYDVRVTTAVRGRHDHDATLGTILRKVFHRTRLGMPLWLAHRTLPGGAATGGRAAASACLLAAVAALPLPVLAGPAGGLVPAALAGAAVGLDARTYRHAFASGGASFGLYFAGVHLLVTLTSAVAAGLGVLRYARQRLWRGRPGGIRAPHATATLRGRSQP